MSRPSRLLKSPSRKKLPQLLRKPRILTPKLLEPRQSSSPVRRSWSKASKTLSTWTKLFSTLKPIE
jgi:hypothetical protein